MTKPTLRNYKDDKDVTITVLHTGNFHASFEEVLSLGGASRYGVARIIHFVQTEKANSESTFYFDTMDCFTGTIWYSIHGWKICAAFHNIMDIDALGLGDSEFCAGMKEERERNFASYMKACNKTVLCANCEKNSQYAFPNLLKHKIFEVKGRKIGVTAYVASYLVEPDIGLFDITDETVAIQKEVDQFLKDGVNIIIVISHSVPAFDEVLVKSVGNIDLIVGGHEHYLYYNGDPPSDVVMAPYPKILKDKNGKDVLLVHAGSYGEYVGKVTLTFDPLGRVVNYTGNPVHMNEMIERNPDATKLLDTFRPPVTKARNTILGQTRVKLDSDCEWQECNLGNLITDVFIRYKASLYSHDKYWTNTPISVMDYYSIRATIDINFSLNRSVTAADVYSALPFRYRLKTVTFTGESLRKILEYSVSLGQGATAGEFLQVSGIQVVYDMSRPKFERIISLKVRCGYCEIPQYSELKDTNKYNVILTDYLAQGNRGFTIVPGRILEVVNEKVTDTEVLEKYIRNNKIIYAQNEERIQVLNVNKSTSTKRMLINKNSIK